MDTVRRTIMDVIINGLVLVFYEDSLGLLDSNQ